jgi:heme/copper-type cytochrome/quinol oxidase subunit 2
MSLAFRKLRTYARLTLMVAVAIVVVLVLFKNRNHQATVWFFHKYENINVVWLLVVTAAGSVMAFWLTRGVFQVIKEVKKIRTEEETQRMLQDHKTRAKELSEQEKRIDAKLKTSLDSKGEDSA